MISLVLKTRKCDVEYYSQYRIYDLFELQEFEQVQPLGQDADRLPWARIVKEYNKRLRNSHCGAGNKSAGAKKISGP